MIAKVFLQNSCVKNPASGNNSISRASGLICFTILLYFLKIGVKV